MQIGQSSPSAKSSYPKGILLNLRLLPRRLILFPSRPPTMHKQTRLIVRYTVNAHKANSEIIRMGYSMSESLPSSRCACVNSSYRVNPLAMW